MFDLRDTTLRLYMLPYPLSQVPTPSEEPKNKRANVMHLHKTEDVISQKTLNLQAQAKKRRTMNHTIDWKLLERKAKQPIESDNWV